MMQPIITIKSDLVHTCTFTQTLTIVFAVVQAVNPSFSRISRQWANIKREVLRHMHTVETKKDKVT